MNPIPLLSVGRFVRVSRAKEIISQTFPTIVLSQTKKHAKPQFPIFNLYEAMLSTIASILVWIFLSFQQWQLVGIGLHVCLLERQRLQ